MVVTRLLQSALAALSEGRVSQVVEHFDDCFTFQDHALTLEFTDKLRLTEFFEKARQLFPDTALEIVSRLESGDQAIAEWKLAATVGIEMKSLVGRWKAGYDREYRDHKQIAEMAILEFFPLRACFSPFGRE